MQNWRAILILAFLSQPQVTATVPSTAPDPFTNVYNGGPEIIAYQKSSFDDVNSPIIGYLTADAAQALGGFSSEAAQSSAGATPQIKLVSIGNPVLLSTDPDSPDTVFRLTPIGFEADIETLTLPQKKLLSKAATKALKVKVVPSKIYDLTPQLSSFVCQIALVDSAGNQAVLTGVPRNLTDVPLTIQFAAAEGQSPRQLLATKLSENKNDREANIKVVCKASVHQLHDGDIPFKLPEAQIQQQRLVEKLFGDSEEVYVSRVQMLGIWDEVRAFVNEMQDFQIPREDYASSFINGFVKLTAGGEFSGFHEVQLDEALKDLSRYGGDPKTFRAKKISLAANKLIKVETDGDGKKRIVIVRDIVEQLNKTIARKWQLRGWLGASGILDALLVARQRLNDSPANPFSESIDEQLAYLNRLTTVLAEFDSVTGKAGAEKIVLKSLNLARISKAKLAQGPLVFSNILLPTLESFYTRTFMLNTAYAKIRTK